MRRQVEQLEANALRADELRRQVEANTRHQEEEMRRQVDYMDQRIAEYRTEANETVRGRVQEMYAEICAESLQWEEGIVKRFRL
jgi:hypothetical protein